MNIRKGKKNWLYRQGTRGPWKKIPGMKPWYALSTVVLYLYVRGQGSRPLSIGERIAA